MNFIDVVQGARLLESDLQDGTLLPQDVLEGAPLGEGRPEDDITSRAIAATLQAIQSTDGSNSPSDFGESLVECWSLIVKEFLGPRVSLSLDTESTFWRLIQPLDEELTSTVNKLYGIVLVSILRKLFSDLYGDRWWTVSGFSATTVFDDDNQEFQEVDFGSLVFIVREGTTSDSSPDKE